MMTTHELRELRLSLNLNQGQTAFLVGVDSRTYRYWENGQRAVPEPVVRLLRIAAAYPVAFDYLQGISDTPARRPSRQAGA